MAANPKEPNAERAELGRVVVRAGTVERNHSVVTFPLTLDAAIALVLRDARGEQLPLQRHADGTATFILDSLGTGQHAAFTIERADAVATDGPNVIERGKALELSSNARTVVRFQMQGELPPGIDAVYLRGGYLHPLFTPAECR